MLQGFRVPWILVAVMLLAGHTVGAEPGEDFDSLVSTEWLSAHLEDADLVVLDCSVDLAPRDEGGFRLVSGRERYELGHIPGAGFAELRGDLCDTTGAADFGAIANDDLAAALGALGVGDATRVVLYDRANSVWAARVWWMLRSIGHGQAAILDGGWKRWIRQGRPREKGPVTAAGRTLTVRPRPELVVGREQVLEALDADGVTLVDGLSARHFRGEVTLYTRTGHLPGAINLPASELLDVTGRYRPLDELREMVPIDPGRRVITYCGSGAAASSVAFTLHRLGYADVAVYLASMQEWAADPTCPLETTVSESR